MTKQLDLEMKDVNLEIDLATLRFILTLTWPLMILLASFQFVTPANYALMILSTIFFVGIVWFRAWPKES